MGTFLKDFNIFPKFLYICWSRGQIRSISIGKQEKVMPPLSSLHVVFFIRNIVKMCTLAIFRFCTVVSYFFPGILDSRFLVVYENMQNFVFGFF